MERNEFKKRLKCLMAWILAIMLTWSGLAGNVMSVYAAVVTIPIKYNTDGGIINEESNYSKSVEMEETATTAVAILPEVTKEGYIFVCWMLGECTGLYGESGEEIELELGLTPNDGLKEIVLTASWNEALFSDIIYSFPGATMNGENDTYTERVWQKSNKEEMFTDYQVSYVPQMTGYIFNGWKMSATDAGGYYDEETGILEGLYGFEYIFEADFVKAMTINATFDANGGTGLTTENGILYQEEVNSTDAYMILPEAVHRAGYSFLGWKDNINGKIYPASTKVGFDYGAVSDVTFTAQWEEKPCTLSLKYNTDGGTITSESYTQSISLLSMDTTAEKVILPEVTKSGYSFKNWRIVLNNTTYPSGTVTLDWGSENSAYKVGTLELVAEWEQDESVGTIPESSVGVVTVQTGSRVLDVGVAYFLNEGNWLVEGDNTVYSGGNVFYIPKAGTYHFSTIN